MANVYLQDSTLTAIGNAIRTKAGNTTQLLPSEMPAAITNLPSGGGGKSQEEMLQDLYGINSPIYSLPLYCSCDFYSDPSVIAKEEYIGQFAKRIGSSMDIKNNPSNSYGPYVGQNFYIAFFYEKTNTQVPYCYFYKDGSSIDMNNYTYNWSYGTDKWGRKIVMFNAKTTATWSYTTSSGNISYQIRFPQKFASNLSALCYASFALQKQASTSWHYGGGNSKPKGTEEWYADWYTRMSKELRTELALPTPSNSPTVTKARAKTQALAAVEPISFDNVNIDEEVFIPIQKGYTLEEVEGLNYSLGQMTVQKRYQTIYAKEGCKVVFREDLEAFGEDDCPKYDYINQDLLEPKEIIHLNIEGQVATYGTN